MLTGRAERTVETLMTSCPFVVPEEETIAGVAELLAGFDISGVPVVDHAGRLTGVITQTDLVRLRGASLPSVGWHGLIARDLMTSPARTVSWSASVEEAARRMTDGRVHRLIVVDDHDAPIGVISESDLVREIADACDDC
jgi:CBS domain-containing protein